MKSETAMLRGQLILVLTTFISVHAEHRLHSHRNQWRKTRLHKGYSKHKSNLMKLHFRETLSGAHKREQGGHMPSKPSRLLEGQEFQSQNKNQAETQSNLGHSFLMPEGKITSSILPDVDQKQMQSIKLMKQRQQQEDNLTAIEGSDAGAGVKEIYEVQSEHLGVERPSKERLQRKIKVQELSRPQWKVQLPRDHPGETEISPDLEEKHPQTQDVTMKTNYREKLEHQKYEYKAQPRVQRISTNQDFRLQHEQNTMLGVGQGKIQAQEDNAKPLLDGNNNSTEINQGKEQQQLQKQHQDVILENTKQLKEVTNGGTNGLKLGQSQMQSAASRGNDSLLQEFGISAIIGPSRVAGVNATQQSELIHGGKQVQHTQSALQQLTEQIGQKALQSEEMATKVNHQSLESAQTALPENSGETKLKQEMLNRKIKERFNGIEQIVKPNLLNQSSIIASNQNTIENPQLSHVQQQNNHVVNKTFDPILIYGKPQETPDAQEALQNLQQENIGKVLIGPNQVGVVGNQQEKVQQGSQHEGQIVGKQENETSQETNQDPSIIPGSEIQQEIGQNTSVQQKVQALMERTKNTKQELVRNKSPPQGPENTHENLQKLGSEGELIAAGGEMKMEAHIGQAEKIEQEPHISPKPTPVLHSMPATTNNTILLPMKMEPRIGQAEKIEQEPHISPKPIPVLQSMPATSNNTILLPMTRIKPKQNETKVIKVHRLDAASNEGSVGQQMEEQGINNTQETITQPLPDQNVEAKLKLLQTNTQQQILQRGHGLVDMQSKVQEQMGIENVTSAGSFGEYKLRKEPNETADKTWNTNNKHSTEIQGVSGVEQNQTDINVNNQHYEQGPEPIAEQELEIDKAKLQGPTEEISEIKLKEPGMSNNGSILIQGTEGKGNQQQQQQSVEGHQSNAVISVDKFPIKDIHGIERTGNQQQQMVEDHQLNATIKGHEFPNKEIQMIEGMDSHQQQMIEGRQSNAVISVPRFPNKEIQAIEGIANHQQQMAEDHQLNATIKGDEFPNKEIQGIVGTGNQEQQIEKQQLNKQSFSQGKVEGTKYLKNITGGQTETVNSGKLPGRPVTQEIKELPANQNKQLFTTNNSTVKLLRHDSKTGFQRLVIPLEKQRVTKPQAMKSLQLITNYQKQVGKNESLQNENVLQDNKEEQEYHKLKDQKQYTIGQDPKTNLVLENTKSRCKRGWCAQQGGEWNYGTGSTNVQTGGNFVTGASNPQGGWNSATEVPVKQGEWNYVAGTSNPENGWNYGTDSSTVSTTTTSTTTSNSQGGWSSGTSDSQEGPNYGTGLSNSQGGCNYGTGVSSLQSGVDPGTGGSSLQSGSYQSTTGVAISQAASNHRPGETNSQGGGGGCNQTSASGSTGGGGSSHGAGVETGESGGTVSTGGGGGQGGSSGGTESSSSSSGAIEESDEEFEKESLLAHNHFRQIHKVPPMLINRQLSNDAKAYAEKIAKAGSLTHSTQLDRNNAGENLAMGCKSHGVPLTGKQAVTNWYNEVCKYNFDNPSFSKDTGHFTQVVWKDSVQLGIGKARGKWQGMPCIYVVGRYKVMGNFNNQYKQKVLKGTFDPSYCKSIYRDRNGRK